MKGLFSHPHNTKGFTLVELLIVIAIIGLLASVILISLSDARTKSRDARRIADVRELANAANVYHTDFVQFPQDLNDLTPRYISSIPSDPTPGVEYVYESSACSPSRQGFVIRAELETDHAALDLNTDATHCGVDCSNASRFYCIVE